MENASPWHEDPAFWKRFRDLLFPPEKFEEAPEQVTRVAALADLEDGARVLDLPCGVGRHAVELASRGYSVTGVDATDSYLEAARENARAADVDVEFVREDMREFHREGAFDAVVNLYTSFGYFEDRDDDERTARNVYDSLRPGGALVMSLTSKEVLAGEFEKRTWDRRDGAYVLEEHEVTRNWSWMENRWIVVEDGEVHEFDVSHRLYSAYELTELLEGVGFSGVSVYGDLEGSDYDEDAAQLVVVAEK